MYNESEKDLVSIVSESHLPLDGLFLQLTIIQLYYFSVVCRTTC